MLFENLQTRQQGSSFLTELKQKLLLPSNDVALAGTRYNVPLINSLVLYVGMQVLVLMLILCLYISFVSKVTYATSFDCSNTCLFKISVLVLQYWNLHRIHCFP